MENNIFRKKSLERVSSPEQLNDYVRVSNPGVWMVLTGAVILLIGVCVWGIFGRLETKLPAAASVKDGSAVCYVRESDIGSVCVGQTVLIGGGEYTVSAIGKTPFAVTGSIGDYVLHIGSLTVGEWVYGVTFDTELADGVYSADIVTDSVSPLSFVLN